MRKVTHSGFCPIWRVAIVGASLFVLSGCQIFQATPKTVVPPTCIALLDSTIIIRAPEGYCIDEDSLQDHARSGFVLMAGCDGLMGLPSGTMVSPAVLTVVALLPETPVTTVQDITQSLEGGTVLAHREQEGLTLLQLEAPEMVPEDSAPRHWRGAMVVNGAVLTLAVYGNDDIAGDRGQVLLKTLAGQIREASGKTDIAVAKAQKKTQNLFQRIFN